MRINVLSDDGSTYEERKTKIDNYFSSFFRGASIYLELPSSTAPYVAGKLEPEYIQDAVNTVNYTRFLAGLPDDVTTTDALNEIAQYAAVLAETYAAIYRNCNHNPPRPADMPVDFYNKALSGTSNSNLGYGRSTLTQTILFGWMADENPSNISSVGHRRWILNPRMLYTGFGQENMLNCSAMYAFDTSRIAAVDYQAICYPGGAAFPSNVFLSGYPWSVTLNPNLYNNPNINDITVTISGGGWTWNLSKTSTNVNGDYLNIETSGYGVPNCIIFRPSGISSYSGVYNVKVEGLKTKTGQDAYMDYSVRFYSQIVRGDINGDGKIDAADLTYLKRYLSGRSGFNYTSAMDVNNNGNVDAADLTYLKRYLAGRPGFSLG